ncbi:unnamed protein product [Paramecium sonneborni]|uniref:RING-type domain-containing protein n=1 Tax=Paramecium sonneborni TaxID=65129 RepID=A0A8S1QIR6_9CILI|nr:unnamed protein product [Paramecium sonneborni]
MRSIERPRQQIKYFQQLTRQFSNQEVSTKNQVAQQPLSFGKVALLLYLFMLYILVIISVTIVAILKNQEQEQVIILCILIILIQSALFGCTVYVKLQISEAQDRWYRVVQESQMNKQVYSSSHNFYLLYTDQSKFTMSKLIQLYCSFALLFLILNIIDRNYYDCNDKQQNRKYINSNNKDCIKYSVKPKFEGPMLIPLSVLCIIQLGLLLGYQISGVYLKLEILVKKCQWPSYQYNNQNLNITKTIIWSKVFCMVFLLNSIGKFVALVIILIQTQNETSKILIYSNLFYHAIMIIFILIIFRTTSSLNNGQQHDDLQFINHQILIESLLQRNNTTRLLFKLFLVLSCIFTAVGIMLFEIQMEMTDVVINYDIFIVYDCAIAQLVLIGLMIIKYLIFPILDFGDVIQKFENQPQENYEQQVQTVEQQQMLILVQRQQEINIIPINNPVILIENNRSNQQKLPPLSTIEDNFIFQVELNEKLDCTICLQQLIQYSATNRVVQLKCHINHIFHQKCITNWLNQNKKCPICNTEFQ